MMFASQTTRSIRADDRIREKGDPCLAAFAETLANNPNTTIEAFLSSRAPNDRGNLPSLIEIDLRERLKRGLACSVEDYFERFPELKNDHKKAVDLIYAEYCERKQCRQVVESAEYYQRFPDLADSLFRVFRIDSLLGIDESLPARGGDVEPLKLLKIGDAFLDFSLVSELGQGAFGRVFLAEQISLSNRLVVVKITSARTIEHQTLARLRHPNIVPVFSVHRDEQTRLQAVCMPHQGAVSLASVLSTWSAGQGTPSGADAFLDALEKLSPPDSRKLDAESDASTFPRRRTFVYACVWLFHRLALGLAHAHARGILHRDLKPSNVLLTPSGQPLLADFNLAFNQVDSPDNAAAFFGGTLGYMPPEQLEALHPAEQGSPDEVDSRSDVFGLAATLFELLTGQLPFGMPSQDQDQWSALREQIERRYTLAPSARGLNRHVSWDLSALLSKCLDPNPDRRYESATDLADDLARYLENRSLGRIGKIPRRDRTWKYVVRNWPRLIAAAGSLTVAAAIAGTVYDAQVTRNKLLRADLERVNLERDKALAEKEAEKARTDLVLAKATARDQVETELKELMPKIRHLSPQEQAAQVFRVGWFAQNQSRFHHAIMFYDRAIEMGYEDAQVFYFRGASHAFLDEDREAVRDFTEAIARRPDFARYYVSRAVTFASAPDPTVKDYDKALLDAEKALEKCPENDPETTKEVFFRVAGVLSAASKGPCSVSSETLLERAEEYLLRAMDLGYSPQGVLREHRLSRFKMLETVLARPRVRERMEDEP